MNNSKLKTAGALILVVLLIIATNLIDSRNFQKLSAAMETMYEDRLVAKDILFDLSLLMHQKSLAIAREDSVFVAQSTTKVNDSIGRLVDLFSKTTLTQEEQEAFIRLQRDIARLDHYEQNTEITSVAGYPTEHDKEILVLMEVILADLHVLSKIQIEEGTRQMHIAKGAARSVDLLSTMEIYILIAIGIVFQAILFGGFRNLRNRNIKNNTEAG